MSIARQKFCYLVVLNKKFLTQLASDLIPQIEQVLSQNGIIMQQGFYKARLKNLHGIEVITPHAGQQKHIHEIIYQELCQGEIKASSRDIYLNTIDDLTDRGAKGIILGCTEIGLLVQQHHTAAPLYDTAALHAKAAVKWALGDTSGFIFN